MHCPQCQFENRAGVRFCEACGVQLTQTCPACGTAVPVDRKFCGACGQALTVASQPPERFSVPHSYTPRHLADKILTSRSALQGERKPVTVLFADTAGFSTLSEALQPEDVHTIMDGCFERLTHTVHRYEGTINQFTGDGIMALFGAPIAHEDHAVRALHATLDIQTAMREYGATVRRQWAVPFQMRLGLNTGMVVVGRIGDDLRMDYTAQGDTVNLAARMQQMAPPGAIWVAEATYRAAREAFTWQALGPMVVKGRASPVEVYELCGRREIRSRFELVARQGLTRFVGRDPELEQLLAVWRHAQDGHGHVVSVVGGAGLGKSRLLYEFKQQLGQTGARYVEGTCFTYGESISYLPFLDVVQACCGLVAGSTEAEAKRRISAHLATLALQLEMVAPYLYTLLSLPGADEVVAQLTPEMLRQRTVTALKTLVVAEARHRPLAFILEDVHWIDKATEEVVGAVVEAMAAVPLLLVLVYRPEYLHAWANRAYHAQITLSGLARTGGTEIVRAILNKPYASQVPLAPLGPAQRTAMAQDLLGSATIPPELEQLLLTKTDGNPLFIEELTRSLLESGLLLRTPEGYSLTRPMDTLDLPTTIQGVLLARIDRLRDDLKAVLQLASVGYPLLARVVPHDIELEEVLLQLADLEFVYVTSLAPQREYSFKHVLTQEAVYSTLLRPQREVYHEWIGDAVEALYLERLEEYYEVLAYHYVRSGDQRKAVAYVDLANQKAMRAHAVEEAKGYFDTAMQLLDVLPETVETRQRRITLLIRQGPVFLLLLRLPEYYDLLRRYTATAMELGQPELEGVLAARKGWCEWSFAEFDQAIRTLTRAAQLCEAAQRYEDAGQSYVHMAWSRLQKGDCAQVWALRDEVARMMDRQFNIRWYVYALSAASIAYAWSGRWTEALAEGHEALRASEALADTSLLSTAAWTLSHAYTCQGDLVRAAEYGELAVQNAPTLADTMWSQGFLGWAWCRQGELERGIDALRQVISTQRKSHYFTSEMFAPYLGEGYLLAGAYDQARQTLEEHLAIAERCGMKFNLGLTHRLLGEIALTTNPHQREEPLAAPHFEQSIAMLQQIHTENELALAYAGYGRLHAQHGHSAQAREYLTRALDIFERLGTLGEPDKVRQALAALPEG